MLVATSLAAPWGPILLAATDRGVVGVELMANRDAFSDQLQRRVRAELRWVDLGSPGGTASGAAAFHHLRAASEVLAWVGDLDRAGQAPHAPLAPDEIPLDLADRPDWDRMVLEAVRAIPWGETRSYGDVARAIHRPGAARAVGGAVGRNPIALIIPCHRVIAGDGTLGGYGGGWWGEQERLLDLKAELLASEGQIVRRRAP